MSNAGNHLPPFGGREARSSADGEPAVAVLPVPYDATACYRTGSRLAPAAILEASTQVELFDEELAVEPHLAGIETLPAVEPDARGPEYLVAAVKRIAAEQLDRGRFLLALGGEHTISLGCLQAQIERQPDFDVLHLDAHADLRDTYQNSPFSHACVMRRVADHCRVVNVGLRSLSRPEHEFIKARGLQPFSMQVIRRQGDWLEQLLGRLRPRVYVTIDLDVFDPAVCPGVGTPEPGGLDWYQVTGLLRAVAENSQIIGADIVECIPQFNPPQSEFLAARLAVKLIAYRFHGLPAAGPGGKREES